MAQKNKENQKTEEKSSKASESIDDTMAMAEAALEETGDIDAAFNKLTKEADEPSKPEATEQETSEPASKVEASQEDDDDEYGLPDSYRKETRELFAKLPKDYDSLKKDFAKRARAIEKDRQKFYSEYQSKTAFAQKLAQAINPYLETFTARGITPEVAIARAAKLDVLIQQDPVAAAKFAMQIAKLRELKLDDDEIIPTSKKDLTEKPAITQDDIRRLVQEEVTGITQATSKYQSNYEVVKTLAEQKTQSGKLVYPDLQNSEFCDSIKADVEALVNAGRPFDVALKAAYISNGGQQEYEQPASQRSNVSQQRDSERLKRLQVASNLRPANSSTNSMRLDDVKIPDSIEDTFALAEKLLGG